MEQFLGILTEMKQLEHDLDEGDQLSKFFGLIQRFNKGKLIPIQLQQEIQEYFDYRWHNDKNAAINDDSEVALLTQLPQDTQDKLLNGFLFRDFIRTFRLFFRMTKDSQYQFESDMNQKFIRQYYTWNDQSYREFMNKVLRALEPRFIQKKNIIINELDEFGEIIFVKNGVVGIGFEINK
jgi:hypothetical protein